LLKLKIFENVESFFERHLTTEDEIIAGRNADCDLVLESRRISKKHCRIYFKDHRWHIEDLNSQNGTIVNDAKVKEQILEDGDVIQIGDFRVEVHWQPAVTRGAESDEDDDRTVVIASPEYDDRTVVAPLSPATDSSGDGFPGKIAVLLQTHKIAAGLAGGALLLLLAVFIIMAGPDKDLPDEREPRLTAESDEAETVHDLETRERISAYIQNGRNHLETGNFSQALVRFQAVLEVDPQNQAARSYLAETREKMAAAEERRRKALEEERQRQQRVNAISARARQSMAGNDYDQALEIIEEAVFLDPDNPDVVRLKAEIKNGLRTRQLTRQQEEAQRAEKMKRLKQHFDQGQSHYDQKNYRKALREWEAVLAMDIETAETAHTRPAIVQLRSLLAEEIKEDYETAIKLYEADDFTGVLSALQKVAEVSPDYRDTQSIMNEVFLHVESKARRLYQEGLVYEGLGQRQRALEKWRAVLDVMPLAENDYHQRALAKLQ